MDEPLPPHAPESLGRSPRTAGPRLVRLTRSAAPLTEVEPDRPLPAPSILHPERPRLFVRLRRSGLPLVAGSFLASRALYVLTVYLLAALALPAITHSHATGSSLFALTLRKSLFNSDSRWYYNIAIHGYLRRPFTLAKQRNWAFFPLYPYLTRWIGQAVHISIVYVGYVLSSIAFLGFLAVLWRWMARHASPAAARTAVLLAAFTPFTPYFVAYRSDAVFLFLSVASLEALDREAWIWALGLGALASLARPTGILLGIAFVAAVVTNRRLGLARRLALTAAAVLFATGFAVVGWLDKRATGNALAFIEIQKTWGRNLAYPFEATIRWLSHPTLTSSRGWGFPALAIIISLSALALAAWLFRSRWWRPGALHIIGTVLFVNSSNMFMGIPRFVMEAPAVYPGAAMALRRRGLRTALVMASTGLMVLYTALWVLSVNAVKS